MHFHIDGAHGGAMHRLEAGVPGFQYLGETRAHPLKYFGFDDGGDVPAHDGLA